LDRERLRADARDLFIDVSVEALDKRIDDDHGHHANDHAEERKSGTELVGPNGGQRQFQSFDKFHE